MELLETFITDVINDNLWMILPFLLVAAGLYFGARTMLVQIRMIPEMFKAVVEKPAKDGEFADKQDISAFKAFTISAASRVGTANVAGVALAITLGGPGAVFWMWIIALVGGATSFIESTLAQLWKVKDGDSYRGGPAYYMTLGLNARWLAVIFGVAITLTFGFVYNALQSNAVVEAITVSLGTPSTTAKAFVGLGMAALSSLVIFGGVQRIANVTQWMVPFMAGAYIIVGVLVIVINIQAVPAMINDIIAGAFGFRPVATASVWGAFWLAFMNGMRRGLFSNEAGEGSVPNAAATATVSHPVKQGLVQTLGVYFDTLLVCSITAFIILLSGVDYATGDIQSSSLTQSALSTVVGGWGVHFITAVMFFLAFSSVLGNYYLAQANIQYFTDSKIVMLVFRLLVLASVFFGAIASVPLIWALGDTFAGIMVVINLSAIVPLGGVAYKLLRNYTTQKKAGLDPVFHRDMLPEVRNIACWNGTDAATENYKEAMEVVKKK
ncbi:putative sodium/glutamine symporter GlnT [Corynebacterium deserti GIMN1.010]|uniref:Putative sodium/glutamine symporter GlnT n=1 Tax=Corynebacterium deserti GIMN1.010 TaxID=931089 RepID=A0A0M3Q8Z5_9CORY|nr:sodium:alanine symporter family protein [Corynebacterium deserti]ALC04713.1 putative sodium/glutamine symporter GlnT [Corynebacterium deserti GIMN1.010]